MTFAESLRARAQALGLTLPEVVADADDPLRHATVPSVMAIRDPLEVGMCPWPGDLYFDGWGQGVQFVDGQTSDEDELARIAHAWHSGVPVREIHAMAQYSSLGPLAEAAEQGAEEVIAAGWRYLRALAVEAELPQFQEMVEAAYAEPRLRRHFPFTGMREVSFLDKVLPFGRTLVKIVPAQPGFNVLAGEEIHYAATPQEAVEHALRRL